ncbi:hypothetical protein MLD38_016021 [Melastoma candidum]|uniref:Uncharacterized protein n=1 Tax=Melastoma candidum TaxID=119954 RepID=A0ACB9RLQ4_9MYRT|nr:hypothetical protein MLD38_016021 [Melastoma candidum]
MRDGNSKKSKLSWPKTLVKKWLNIKSKAEDFQADDIAWGGSSDEGGAVNICTEREREWEWERERWEGEGEGEEEEACTTSTTAEAAKKIGAGRTNKRSFNRVRRGKIDLEPSEVTDVHNYRIFVATWNVAGKSPPSHLNLEDWLHSSPPADIYVLGFQEIVPLNAGNVLGTEDNEPAKKWQALVRKTLNSLPGTSGVCRTPSPIPNPVVELDVDFESARKNDPSPFLHRRSFQSTSYSMRVDRGISPMIPHLDRRYSVCDRVMFGDMPTDYDYGCNESYDCNYQRNNWYNSPEDDDTSRHVELPGYSYNNYYNTQASDGRCDSMDRERHSGWSSIRNLKVSCVGRGLMGYLGNKGSISVSLCLHQTSFCFICSHLTSGQKEGDELRRNSDVMEILRKTRFPRVNGVGDENSPETILEHDRVIWLGDLNYRIALSYRSAKALVEMRNWQVLLENDQLHREQREGRVFVGWNEGNVYFPPTYKYSYNSDRYTGDDRSPKRKRRTPAWCDRILWYGRGLYQLSYVRGESKFSDHRPVYGIFLAEVEYVNRSRIKKSSTYSASRIKGEEPLPYANGYTGFDFY